MSIHFNGNIFTTEKPNRDYFKLHTHEHYEIYVFLSGDTNYIVEGTTYNLEPYDIIVLRPGEMHKPYHKAPKKYTRIIFEVNDDFFDELNCPCYKNIFNNREFGKKNKIPGEFVKNSGLSEAINKWFKYTDFGKSQNLAISYAVFIEILHIMNNIDAIFDEEESKNLISGVISYINSNYTEKITIDDLAKEFYVSKFHLCRKFKKATGHTIIEYINNKRLTKTKELYKSGYSINKACLEAGFSSYSSFYKIHLKEFGVIPKVGLN